MFLGLEIGGIIAKKRNDTTFSALNALELANIYADFPLSFFEKLTSRVLLIRRARITLASPFSHQRHSFARFAASLVVLDLHESGIESCDASAFVGLTKLEKLMLWGNKLTFVPGDWFVNTRSLKTLDLSFNFIQAIDYAVFQMLPHLENFYFDYNQLRFIDYNMFAYLGNLKKVKFSKNPWSWP